MTTQRLRALSLPALAVVVVAVLALVLRSPSPAVHTVADDTVRSGHVTVSISMYQFSPDTVTVKAGTEITFVNHDDTAHTATANHGAFDTGSIQPGHRRTIRVTKAGIDPYHCVFHAFMTGTVKVVG